MKPSLQLKLSQQLTLTPQLQQSIRLLQLSTLELDQEIERFLHDNPMLERDEVEHTPIEPGLATSPPPEQRAAAAQEGEASAAGDEASHIEPGQEQEGIDWSTLGSAPSSTRDDDEDSDFQSFHAAERTLRDHLDEQIALSPLSDADRALVRFVIEALDDDGYLHQALEELLALLPAAAGIGIEELEIALRHVHSLDPTGVGARSVAECLGLQLRAQTPSAVRELALAIVDSHLELLAERNFLRLKKELGCSEAALRDAHQLILGLDPHPGARYAVDDTRYVIPDVVVRKIGREWTVLLNQEAMPRLRINQLYARLLQQNRSEGGSLNAQLQEARWLIKNVQQRFDTIQRVSQAIVDRQSQFFDHGEVAMRPLTLREIADELELHESTISRVTTQKYMSTPRGVFELKYFFGSYVSTDTGGAASATAIRALIRQLVDAENKKKPLSDTRIAELLGEQGIVVARRTVAKYREALGIPAISQRKSL